MGQENKGKYTRFKGKTEIYTGKIVNFGRFDQKKSPKILFLAISSLNYQI
jgi:hypothetical protein